MQVSYGEVIRGRHEIAEYVARKKSAGAFTVIDVGGSAVGWSVNITDAVVDINDCPSTKLSFRFDICKKEGWRKLFDYADRVGKFDYCICTHTLEDIYNPYLVLDSMPKIAKAGIITMPSVKTEVNFIESLNWLGFAHHRYLFGYKDGTMMIAPKLPVIEKLSGRVTLKEVEEIRFQWRDSIEYQTFMGNYLGPNTDTVLKNYEQFIKEQA
jgi:hypothetical protein